jgi:uncharacterized protein YbjT (DUF2867 family)
MKIRTAIVFGATGLVGKALVEELCKSDRYSTIKIFVRSKTDFVGREKIIEIILDFNNLKEYSEMITGDDLFICTGTTIKKAGTIRKMEEIDRDLPIKIASLASSNSVQRMAVISSIGADHLSSNNYLRMKGEMEQGLMKLKFSNLVILRPSILLGSRSERRTAEALGKVMIRISGPFMIGRLAKYKGIEGTKVAFAMVRSIAVNSGIQILESDEIQKISRN